MATSVRERPVGWPQAGVPDRSLEQRLEALQRANRVRFRRAQLKRDLKAGREDVVRLLLDPPEWIESMKVIDLLLARPKWGRIKVNTALRRCEISPSKHCGGLSARQRQQLVAWLRGQP